MTDAAREQYKKARREKRRNTRHRAQLAAGSSQASSLRGRSEDESDSDDEELEVYNKFGENLFDSNPPLQCLKCKVRFLAPTRTVAVDPANNAIGPQRSHS